MIERIFFGQHYSFIFHPVYMYVRYCSMTLSDTYTIRRSWTLHAVPGLPVVVWGERGNILLARSFHAAHYDRDSCEKSAWKYRGNIVRWTWILQRFNEERNPFLVCGKTWLIITFRCVYCMYYKQYDAKSAQMSGVCLFSATYWLWSMSLALPRHRHYFQCIFMVQNGKWLSIAECICVEVLRHSQQLRSCRAGQLPINTVPGQASTY